MRAASPAIERIHSLHLHGVHHTPLYDGAFPFSPNDSSQSNKRGDRLAPGDTFDYHYTVPHLSTAGVWAYYDGAVSQQMSIGLGAFGAVVVRAGGESKPAPPTQPLRSPTDTPTQFANIPQPGGAVEYLFILHELTGIGTCLNGRQLLGNTPTVIGRLNTRIKFRVLNLALRAHVFHLHGHRWKRGDDWTDNETIPPGGGFVFDLQEGTVENGGSNGEWGITIPTAPPLMGSFVVTDGGALTLTTGV